jgi:tRNA uridine 5-carboxymethylaminomethyl modification enzyme
LRADNADQRLTARAITLGCAGAARRHAFEAKALDLAAAKAMLCGLSLSPNEAARHGLRINRDGIRRTAFEILALPDVTISSLRTIWPQLGALSESAGKQIEIDAKYAVYLDRQTRDIEAFQRDEGLAIPGNLDYGLLKGLSNEIRARLELIRPATMGHAGRIEGMTPAALTLLASKVRREGSK